MQNLLAKAISDRSIVEFSYEGHLRIVEPHCLGISTKGNHVLRAFQIGGTSSQADPIGWRLFTVSKILAAQVRGTFTGTRPGYARDDKQMTRVIAAL